MSEFDPGTEFATAFAGLIAQHNTNPLPWRAGGKASKDWPNKEDQGWWDANGPKMVAAWIKWRELNPDWQVWEPTEGYPAIEVDVSFEYNGVLVKGFADRIFVDGHGQLIVVDIKTGSREPDSPTQLALYAMGIEHRFGVRPAWGGYWMARKGFIPTLYSLDPFTNDMVGGWLADFRRAVDAGVFVPHLTNLCKSCGVNAYCAAFTALGHASPVFD